MQLNNWSQDRRLKSQDGINMVDLMMWLVIAALLLAAALQGVGFYQRAAFGHQAKSDLDGVKTWVMTQTSMTSSVPTLTDLQKALDNGDLRLTKNGTVVNTPLLASSGSSYCVGVRAASMSGTNIYYASSIAPADVKTDTALPASCGTSAEAVPMRSMTDIATNFASLTWTLKSSLSGVNWLSVDTTGNGQNVIAGQNLGYIYTSTDGGGSWTKRDFGTTVCGGSCSAAWWGVGMSNDGQKLIAASTIGVFTSADGGGTWKKASTLPAGSWTRVASSSDGTRLVASQHDANGYVYTSSDSGLTWTQRLSSGASMWQSLASSADGRVIVSGTNGAGMYISKDYGNSWSQMYTLGNGDWHDVDISSDGTRIITGEASNYLYTSSDSGDTWKQETAGGVLGWRGVAASDDGKVLVAGQRNGYIYTSIDGGLTWVQRADSYTGVWYAIASTADGSKIMAGQFSSAGNFYVGTYGK